jgi:hypothetical protein
VDDTQKLFSAEMDTSYCKVTQRLFDACQLKLAANYYSRSRQQKAGAHECRRSLHVMSGPAVWIEPAPAPLVGLIQQGLFRRVEDRVEFRLKPRAVLGAEYFKIEWRWI